MRTPVEQLIAWLDACIVAYQWNCLNNASFWSRLTGRASVEAAQDAAWLRREVQDALLELLESLESGASSPDVIDNLKSARLTVAEWKKK